MVFVCSSSLHWNTRIKRTHGNYSYLESDVVKVHDRVVYTGYRNIVERSFILPHGKNVSYDILQPKHMSVVVFVFNATSNTTTLIREYHPGTETFMHGVIAGQFEQAKHINALVAAQFELEEEAQLQTDRWIPLLETPDISISLDKYSTNRFYPFLAVDCEYVESPRAMDPEELIYVEREVPLLRVWELIRRAEMNVVSSYTFLLAMQKLQSMGLVSIGYLVGPNGSL